MQEAIQERNDALATLEGQVYELSRLFREGYLSAGRGALIVHTTFLEGGHKPSMIDYNAREESLELFDVTRSTRKLTRMIDGYDPNPGRNNGAYNQIQCHLVRHCEIEVTCAVGERMMNI